MLNKTIIIIAEAGFGKGVSGGDRIFMEFARYWKSQGNRVIILTAEEGYRVCLQSGLTDLEYKIIKTDYTRFNFAYAYIMRIFRSIYRAKKFNFDLKGKLVIYSASDFLADSIPASILKRKFAGSKWIAGFYFFAPHPFPTKDDIKYRGGYILPTPKSVIYYLLQRLAYKKILNEADLILVSNQLDRDIFRKDGFDENRVLPLYGGVNVRDIENIPEQTKIYDACFIGRFHYQKGVMELIKIWRLITQTKPDAELAIIGEGPLENKMRNYIKDNKLEKNIDILGFLNGEAKYKIFKSSKIFLHPPILDTGGMAAAEGMAAGLPVVGFDLPGYKYCYPKGMNKAQIGNLEAFAKLALDLLDDQVLYNKLKQEALNFSKEWDWKKKADLVLRKIEGLYED